MSAVIGHGGHGARPRPRTTTTTSTTARRTAGAAGSIATNHKDIGTMYLLFSFTMFMVGGVLALLHPRRAVPARACSSSTRSCSTS